MAHREQLAWVKSVVDRHKLRWVDSVLEFGSLNFNGSVRSLFEPCRWYTGVDAVDGPGVDWVGMADEYSGPPAHVTVCCEMLEHDPKAQATINKMISLTEIAMIVTCAAPDRPEHGTPGTGVEGEVWGPTPHFYRNVTPRQLLTWVGLEWRAMGMEYSRDRGDLYWWGLKSQ